jgi:catechol 2,3-dioxygenase-like lactoylglutathione lyase family enzyme
LLSKEWGLYGRPTDVNGEVEVAVVGLANLAVKVADLDAACAFYISAGAEVRDRAFWNNGERADVLLGPVMITLFTQALYEDRVELPAEGFLHPALFTDDLDAQLEGHEVIWGPGVVEGAFGKRRIAFVTAPGGIRLEFMEQLAPPPQATSTTELPREGRTS